MKHELLYETQAQFNTAQGNSGNVTSITPGVAYIVETGTVPHFNKTYDNVTIVYKVTDPSVPVKLYNTDITSNLVQAFVDGSEVQVSSIISEYQFETAGLHHILLRYSSLTTLPDSAFTQCTNIINIKLPDSLTKLGSYSFYGCTGFKKFVYPTNVLNIPGYCFYGCSNLERIYFKGVVNINHSGDQGHRYQFQGCSKLKHVYFNSIQQICNGSFYGEQNETYFYHPCSQSKEGHLYIGGEEVFDVVIPEGVTAIWNSNFAFYKYLTSVTFPSTLRVIAKAAFYKCTGLTGLVLPNGLTEIRERAFYGCTGITGPLVLPNTLTNLASHSFYGCSGIQSLTLSNSLTEIPNNVFTGCRSISNELIIPSSITSIGQQAFTNCSSIPGNLIFPSSVKSIGQSCFSGCTNIENVVATSFTSTVGSHVFSNIKPGANVTIKSTVDVYHSATLINRFGTVNITATGVGRSAANTAQIDYFTLNCSYSSSNEPLQGRLSAGYNCIVAKVSGNISASKPNNYFHDGTNRLKFFELMGTINETFAGVATSNETLNSSGCIYHLGYNGIACTPTQANAGYNRLITIYVGDGSSEEADRAVLNQYLANSDWTQYAGKLDIWYNYQGEYRQE